MASYNRVMLMGNLTKDPDLRQLPSGTSVADLGLAVSESYKNREGETVETVCYVDVVVWGRQAETSNEYLSKGSPVFIEGRLQLDEWEKDGEKRSRLRVRAARVQFLSSPRAGAEHSDAAGPKAAVPRSPGDDDIDPDDLF